VSKHFLSRGSEGLKQSRTLDIDRYIVLLVSEKLTIASNYR